MPLVVDELQPRRRRCSVHVAHPQLHRDRRLHGEQHRRLRAEAEVLRSLSDVERDRRLAPSGLARVDQREGVLDVQAAQHRGHRRSREHLHVEKAVAAPLDVLVLAEMRLLHPLARQPGHAGVDRSRLRAADAQPRRAAALVEDLDNRRRVARLLQHRGRGASRHPDAGLGIDMDDEQHAIVEELLEPVGIARPGGCGRHPGATPGATGAPR